MKISIPTFFHLFIIWLLLLVFNCSISVVFAESKLSYDLNGFNLDDTLIDRDEIHHGGPAKDGIPAIDSPYFMTVNDVAKNSLSDIDRVLGLVVNGIAKAYPIAILNYHEIVNDYFADKAVVITYCPLCGTGVAYSSEIKGKKTTFGVSGLLYNSDVLLYDRETESLWSQLLSKAISGQYKGIELEMLPLQQTTWQLWKKEHPKTLVLSQKTGFNRNYGQSPYGDYNSNRTLYFPVTSLNKRYHPKEYVIGLKILEQTKVYPFAELSQLTSPYQDNFAGKSITIIFDATHRTGKIMDELHNEIPTMTSFWFAWMAFYPQSEIFTANQ
jgi:hypothetical protein